MADGADRQPGARFLHLLANLVIVIAGLKLAGPMLVPFVLAAFLAVVTMPVMFGLRVRGEPAPAAIGPAVLLDALVFLLVILLTRSFSPESEFVMRRPPRSLSPGRALPSDWKLGRPLQP